MKKIGIVFSVFAFVIISFQPVRADSDQRVSLALDQGIFSLTANPGEEKDLEINVTNLADKKQLISLEIGDLSIEENNRLDLIIGENKLFGMRNWIISEEKKWIFEPKETKKINLKLKIPRDASVGSHYAGIFFRALPEIQGQNFQNVLVGGQVGAYVLLNVDGKVIGGGKINDFQAPLLAKKENNLKVEFENTGNIHYIPYGEIDIKNIFSRKEEKIELEKHFVFPGKKFSFENNWRGGSVWGAYNVKAFFIDANKSAHFSSRLVFGRGFFVWPFLAAGLFFLVWRERSGLLGIYEKVKFFKNKK